MKRLWKRLVNDQGFTLIELLAVVAILAILAGIGVPRVMSAIQNARAEAEEANEQLMESAIERFIIEGLSQGKDLVTILTHQDELDLDEDDNIYSGTWVSNDNPLQPRYLESWPSGKDATITITVSNNEITEIVVTLSDVDQ